MRFSIIIPVYNGAETILEALESIKKQSFEEDVELLVVDDGSTDKSADIVAEEIAEWQNAKLIQQENKGLGAARNVAVKTASANWLVFLDADDYWASDKLQVISNAISEGNPDLIYHAIYEKYANGKLRKRAFRPISNLEQFILMGNPFVPSAMAIKRELFVEAGGFIEDRNQVEDLLLWFRLLKKAVTLKSINRPLTVYRIGSGVTANISDHLEKVFRAVQSAEEEGLLSQAQGETFRTQKHLEAARQLHKLGEFESALNYYQLAGSTSFKAKILQALCRLGVTI